MLSQVCLYFPHQLAATRDARRPEGPPFESRKSSLSHEELLCSGSRVPPPVFQPVHTNILRMLLAIRNTCILMQANLPHQSGGGVLVSILFPVLVQAVCAKKCGHHFCFEAFICIESLCSDFRPSVFIPLPPLFCHVLGRPLIQIAIKSLVSSACSHLGTDAQPPSACCWMLAVSSWLLAVCC